MVRARWVWAGEATFGNLRESDHLGEDGFARAQMHVPAAVTKPASIRAARIM